MLTPLRNAVCVIPIHEEKVRGLWIPDLYRQRVDHGIVKAKGPQVSDEIQIGDHIVFSGYTGTKISHENEGEYIFVPEPWIEAIITEDPPIKLISTHNAKRIISNGIEDFVIKQKIDEALASEIEGYLTNMIEVIPFSEGLEF